MKFCIALILSIIVLAPVQQAQASCVVAGSDVAAALSEAQAGSRCLDIPAGTYAIGAATSGAWLNVTADNLEMKGAGEGKTILQITSGLTLTQDLIVLRLLGKNQHIHDLTIQIGSGYTGPWGISGISVYSPAEQTLIERVEVVGGYSFDGARGYAIGTYQPFNYHNADQFVTIRDCFIHDGMATGIGINSNSNTIVNNHIARVGLNSFSHGIYAQGGNNLYEGNIVENVTGWSFHGHKQVPSLDGSGDRYIGNLSLNPGMGGIVINSVANGSNPGLPAGVALTRYATIQGNTFRNTGGKRSGGIWCNGVPCVIDGNMLEDTYVTTGGGWIDDSGGSIITNNLLTTSGIIADGPINFSLIRVTGVGSIVANNRLIMTTGCCAALTVTGAEHTIQGNTIRVGGGAGITSGNALVIGGDSQIVTGNRFVSTANMYTLAFSGAPTNLTMTGNTFRRATSLGALFSISLIGVTGNISANVYDGSPGWGGNGAGVLR